MKPNTKNVKGKGNRMITERAARMIRSEHGLAKRIAAAAGIKSRSYISDVMARRKPASAKLLGAIVDALLAEASDTRREALILELRGCESGSLVTDPTSTSCGPREMGAR